MRQSTNRRGVVEPQVWFRIRHVALESKGGAGRASCCDQPIEVTLGPEGAFKRGNVGGLTRRVAAGRVVSALPRSLGKPKPPKKPKEPRVVGLLQMAIEWQRQLDSRAIASQAEISRREGITRARVAQVLALLSLPPDIQERILALPESVGRPAITERALRPIVALDDSTDQRAGFDRLVEHLEWDPE